MKVLKFGGTSVGTVESLRNVKSIIEQLPGGSIVVVSALGGLTDNLIATANLAKEGNQEFRERMEGIRRRHADIIEAMVGEELKEDTHAKVGQLLDELERVYEGISLLGELSDKSLDMVVSFGERMSSIIVSTLFPHLQYYDSLQFVKTEKWFKKNIADATLTTRLIKETFSELGDKVAITGGFISTDRDNGDITNLGRGGSDYTAALIAAALDAEVLEIWTDVDGFMTADPRIIKDARVLDHMTFVESMELCTYGAKVIYPPTIYPVFHKNIPIRILNTFNPTAPGTWIDDVAEEGRGIARGVTSMKNTALISMEGPLTQNVAEINSRTFNALARKGISVFLVSPPAEGKRFTFSVADAAMKDTMDILDDEFKPELRQQRLEAIHAEPGLATIAIVGEKMLDEAGLAARIRNTLYREGIQVLAQSEGTSSTTLTMVIREKDVNEALKVVHSSFF